MRRFFAASVALLALTAPAFAGAQDATPAASAAAPALKNGATLYSVDGKRLGKINRVNGDTAVIIFDSRFVRIPANTISAAEGKLVTSLDYATVRKIK